MRVAVTGGTGFVGGHLVDALLHGGHQVACLARSEAGAARLESRGCRVVRGDLHDASAVAQLCGGAEVLFHVAGATRARSEAEFARVNAEGAALAAGAARQAGVGRLVHVSSLAVTGPAPSGRPLDESGPARPVTRYGRSKRDGEEAVRAGGVPFTILRPPAVYGPGDRELLRVFRLARWGWAPLLGDGRQELSLVFVRDLAEALLAAASSPATRGRVYHAAHPEIVTQRGLVEAIARSLGRAVRLVALPGPVVRALLHASGVVAGIRGRATLLAPDKADELLAPAWTCSSEALARDAGWRAATGLEAGLAETVRGYREAGWL